MVKSLAPIDEDLDLVTRLYAERRQTVSVKEYGAVGDGIADDTTAIQNAINAVNTSGGGRVYFPPGTYLISNHISVKAKVLTYGEYGLSIITCTTLPGSSSSRAAFEIGQAATTDLGAIENLKFNVLSNHHHVLIGTATKARVRKCIFTGTGTTEGMVFVAPYGGGDSENIKINDNVFENTTAAKGVYITSVSARNVSNIEVLRNTFDTTFASAIHIDDGTGLKEHILIKANKFKNLIGGATNATAAVGIFAGLNSPNTINDLQIISNQYYNTRTGSEYQGFAWVYGCSGVKIAQNYGKTANTAQANVIAVAPGRISTPDQGLEVLNNQFEGWETFIDPDSMRYSEVAGNKVLNCNRGFNAGYGIQEYNDWHDNTFYNSVSATATGAIILSSMSSLKAVKIHDNTIIDDRATPVITTMVWMTSNLNYSDVEITNNRIIVPNAAVTDSTKVSSSATGPTLSANVITDINGKRVGTPYASMRAFNVKDYGAVCDGTTDDKAAIKAALDAANSAGGGLVLLMYGIHAIASSISGQYKNVTVRGVRGLTTLKATAAFSNGIIDLDASSTYVANVNFEDCTFDENSQTNVVGVSIKGGTYSAGAYAQSIRFTRVSFKNLGTTDLGHIQIYSGRGTTDRGPVTDVGINDCDFQDTVKYHIYINGGQVEDLRITGNRFRNSQYGCIAFNQQNKTNSPIAAARSHKSWLIEGNRITNNHLSVTALGSQIGLIHDVNKTGVRGLKIRNNYFGPSQSTVSHYCLNLHSMLGLEILDNEFDQCRTAMSIGQSNNGPYYQEDGSREVSVRGNRFYRCFNIADLDSSFISHWQGNKIVECTYGGLTPYSRQFPSIYEGNYFYNTPTDNTGTATQRSAFSVVANGSIIKNNVIIDDRLLSDPTTAPVLTQVSGGSLGARTYFVVYTWENDTGETLKSTESTISVSANNLLKITHPYSTTYGPPTGAKKVNWYVSTTTGTETKQDFTPTPWQQEYEIVKTTFGALNWTEPTTGLITGSALPGANTTQAVMLNGIYEVSGGSGPLIPNFYEDNKFFGNFTPISKQAAYKRVQKNNYFDVDMTSGNMKLVEAMPYAQGNVTGATTFDVSNGEVITATITGNVGATTLSAGHYVGQRLERRFTMGGSGSYTYTKSTNEKLAGGVFLPTSTVGAIDTLIQEWDGTSWLEKQRIMAVA